MNFKEFINTEQECKAYWNGNKTIFEIFIEEASISLANSMAKVIMQLLRSFIESVRFF